MVVAGSVSRSGWFFSLDWPLPHDHQEIGLGRHLLIEAIERAAAAGQHAAARFIAVDPIDDNAQSFYAAFGFKSVEGDDGGPMDLCTDEALAALDEGQV
jgi:predicted N-acetyltransferase YhbS